MFQEIETERLLLRRLRSADAAPMFEYRVSPDVCLYQSWLPESIEEVLSLIRLMEAREISEGWFQLGIALKDGTLIGDLGIHVLESEPRICELGVTLNPLFQSNGYALEALRAVIDFLFKSCGKHRIYASIDPRNQKSLMLFERLGLRKEAHHSKSLWFKNEWVDDVIFAILDEEWK